jgi:hypothetical protein
MNNFLGKAVDAIAEGIEIDNYKIYAKKILKGRFREEENLDICIRNDNNESPLLLIKVFYGRTPYYKPWVEFYNIIGRITFAHSDFEYFGSLVEEKLLSLFAHCIGTSEKIFVEYRGDEETRNQLYTGFPVPVTRLGYLLYQKGFTWFKDWYFPEGFMEGEQKLQGEKPSDEASKERHIKDIEHEVGSFVQKMQNSKDLFTLRALERADSILKIQHLRKPLSINLMLQ